MSISEIAEWNEWWKTGKFSQDDPNIEDWSHSNFKWFPRLGETFEKEEVLYILRGPRRVGKTTLVKLLIRRLLNQGTPPDNVLYFPCDAVETPKQLVTAIETYLTKQRRQDAWAHLFIDEISTLIEWQKTIKVLIDAGKFRDCTVILTGSHSIDLRKGSESLAGRRGKIQNLKYGSPDRILLSAKFAEYVETLNPSLSKEIRNLWLLSQENREKMFLEMACGRIPDEIRRLDVFVKDLDFMLDQYMITGGIAVAINQYVSTRRIADGTYNDYVGLVVRDIIRWKFYEHYARQVLRRIFEVNCSQVSWNDLKNGTDIRDMKTAESYAQILKDSFVINYHYQLDVEKCSADYASGKKIYLQDPFIFHAIRGWVYGKRAFDFGNDYLTSNENKSKLVECIVSNHLSRFMYKVNPSSLFDPSNFVFYWKGKKREVDFVIDIGNKYLPIEVKYSNNVQRDDANGIKDFIKTGCSHKCGILTSRTQLEVGKNYVVIPLGVLLLLA
jgi:predicted AAA+ superfamily ATPase